MTKNELTYLIAYVMLGLNERADDGSKDTIIMNELQVILFPFKDEIMDKYSKMNKTEKQNNFKMIADAINNCKELNGIMLELRKEQQEKEMN